jgi:hypothetical protein
MHFIQNWVGVHSHRCVCCTDAVSFTVLLCKGHSICNSDSDDGNLFRVLRRTYCNGATLYKNVISFPDTLYIFKKTNGKYNIYDLLGYYAASNDNSLPTFRDNLSVPFSRVKKSKKKSGKISNYHSTSRNGPEERTSHQQRGGNLKLRVI